MFLHSKRHGGDIQRNTGPGGPYFYRELSKEDFPGLDTDNMRECIAVFERHSRRLRLSEQQHFEAAIEFLPSEKVGSYFACLEDSERESYDSLKRFLLQHAEPNITHLIKRFSQEARASNINELIETAGKIVKSCPKEDVVMLLVSFLCPDSVKERAQTYIKYGFQRWQELLESSLDLYEEYEVSAALPTNDGFKIRQDNKHLDSPQYFGETQEFIARKSVLSVMNSQVCARVEKPCTMRDASVNTIAAFSQSHIGIQCEELVNTPGVNLKSKHASSASPPTDTPEQTTFLKKIRKLKRKLKQTKGKLSQISDNERSTSKTKRQQTWAEVASSDKTSTITRAKTEEARQKNNRTSHLYTRKQRSVIIFNIPEASDLNDEQYFIEICKALKVHPKVEEMTRIGSCRANSSRPLRVTFEDIRQKKQFLLKATLLKSSELSHLKVSHDMNSSERELNKALLRTAYELNKQGFSKPFVYKLRGPPWDPRITKVTRLTQF